ncbi:MAG: surE [Gammaproteobacteria bacterium]|jgi:5'-nucleotidase|nr:surE [Gammaproteobacteria bacterium]
MHILVSNDDGIHAPGIKALAKAMESLANRVTVVAPDRNRSGASNSLTLSAPLCVKQLSSDQYSVEGTPTDCVHLALTGLLEDRPSMVVSGINQGANVGDDILYSGTVAAATEGRSLGLPSIAFSLNGHMPEHYGTAAEVAKILVARVLAEPLPMQTILNVNIPDVPFSELQGFEVTRLGTRHPAEKTIRAKDPRGQEIFWIGLPGLEQDAGPGTDFFALARNKVSITPINLDLTAYRAFDSLATWVERLEWK